MSDAATIAESSLATIRAGSKSFRTAARLLPADRREDTVLLYAWCRHADDVVDGQTLGGEMATGRPEDVRARLDALVATTEAALRSDRPVAAPFEALRQVARRHDFPDRWPFDLLHGFRMDVEGARFETLDDTLRYAYHVAGVVGVMMARILGVRDEDLLDRASDLGIAFQLTNISRDVMEDARAGRVYLPAEWLRQGAARNGAPPFDSALPFDPGRPEEWDAAFLATRRLLDAAEPYYASALTGLRRLPGRSAWAIAAARRIYRQIGAKVIAGGPDAWRGRVTTSRAEKAILLAKALKDVGLDANAPEAPRDGLWTRPREVRG